MNVIVHREMHSPLLRLILNEVSLRFLTIKPSGECKR